MTENNRPFLWNFTLREAMLLGFCATFIVLTRAALRLHFSLPGHSMFFLMFFLLMSRAAVPKPGSSTLVGLISGLVCMLLGMTKMGPLIIANFILPAIIVDGACALFPAALNRWSACLAIGLLASVSKNFSAIGLDLLLGMEREIILQHVLVTTAGSALFGGAGSLLAPPVIKRLRANRLIPGP